MSLNDSVVAAGVVSGTGVDGDVSWGADHNDDDATLTSNEEAKGKVPPRRTSPPPAELPLPAALAESHLIDRPAVDTGAADATRRASTPTAAAHLYADQPISKSPAFIAFRASVQKQRCIVGTKTWTYFDLGPKDVTPLICIPGTSGTAESFFYSMMSLGNNGYRVISVSPPVYYTHDDWCSGFNGFLYALGLTGQANPNSPTSTLTHTPPAAAAPSSPSTTNSSDTSPPSSAIGKVHVFANSLAGYLMLYYLSHIIPSRNYVASLILCNSFIDSSYYRRTNGTSSSSQWCQALLKRAPTFIVRKYVLDSMPEKTLFPEAIDFMLEQMEENLTTDVLASRLILNICKNRGVSDPRNWKQGTNTFPQERITILDTTDESVLPDEMRQQLYDALPNARYAFLKNGGDMPFISVPDEVNMHLQVHLRHHGIIVGTHAAALKQSNAATPAVDPPSSSSLPSSSSASSLNDLATIGVNHFLQPAISHTLLGKTKHLATGYEFGEEDDEQNDSIFLTKHHQSDTHDHHHPTNTRGTSSSPPPAPSANSPAIDVDADDSLLTPDGPSAEFLAQRDLERREREARLAADAARIAEEAAKDARQEAVMSTLLADAPEEEERLTKKRPIKQHNTDDLF